MQDEVHALHGSFHEDLILDAPFEELHLFKERAQVFSRAGDEAVDDPHLFASGEQLPHQVGTDESRTARDQIGRHPGPLPPDPGVPEALA